MKKEQKVRNFSYAEKIEKVCTLTFSVTMLYPDYCAAPSLRGSVEESLAIDKVIKQFIVEYPEYKECQFYWDYKYATYIEVNIFRTTNVFVEFQQKENKN